jgi:tRNA(fMet)-specific endonuclease VapC
MSLLLLDTTFLIDAERGDVTLDDAIDDDDDVAIAAVTVAELLVGVELASGKRRDARKVYVEEILESLPIIAYDRNVAVEHAELLVAVREQGRPRGAHDLLIAATARATDRTVVTADQEAFTDLPGVATVTQRSARGADRR